MTPSTEGAGPGGEPLPVVSDLAGALALRSRVAAAAAMEARLPAEGAAALPALVSAVVAALLAGGHGTVSGTLRVEEEGGIVIRLRGGETVDGAPAVVSLPTLPPLLPGGVEVRLEEGGGWMVTAPPRGQKGASAPSSAAALVAAETALLRMGSPEGSRPSIGPVLLPPLVEELRAAFAGRARESGVTLDLRSPPEGVGVLAERDRLFTLLADLLGNAFRHSRQGDRITLGVALQGREVRLTVRDTGRGIPPEMLARLFQWEWGPGGSGPVGAGPGLTLVRKGIEAMGGRVSAESEVGRGTAIHLTLPAV
jgi:hypothetical protein